ncbi:hypothetical protein F4779DRAFT_614968 [Xylariaceae sp. FL0662B]|nr:hypothetical protein F4779DRAFT_614968 [Xylariaceae sp. FL0662B]
MASPVNDHHSTSTPQVASQSSRSPDSRHGSVIIVEPTPENQKIYNQIRQEHQLCRLQTDAATQHNLLPPPAAPSMSRSTTNESYGSQSTIHSHVDRSGTPSPQDTATNRAGQPKRPRGRRKGPLDANTRLNTAVKRKLRLACPRHRAKKITCNCHDFSKLEEGYRNSQPRQPANLNNSSDQNDALPSTPIERAPNGDIKTFGITGGAAVTPSYRDADLNDPLESPASARPSVRHFLSSFDTNTIYLNNEIVQASIGQTYYPGSDTAAQLRKGQTQLELFEIGSEMPFANRWRCEYKGPITAASETSSEVCTWTGPFCLLASHFEREHHPFREASPPVWWVCSVCKARTQGAQGAVPPPPCIARDCLASSWQRWYYGSTTTESVTDSVPGLTQYSESEAGHSWDLQPDLNHLWPEGRGSNHGYNSYFDANSFHERSGYSDAEWDTNSDCPNHAQDCGLGSRNCPLKLFTWEDTIGWDLTEVSTKTRTVWQPKSSKCIFPILWSYGRLPLCHLLSVMLPLITTVIMEVNRLLVGSDPLSSYAAWWSIALFLLGFVATWILKYWSRPRTADEKHSASGDHEVAGLKT